MASRVSRRAVKKKINFPLFKIKLRNCRHYFLIANYKIKLTLHGHAIQVANINSSASLEEFTIFPTLSFNTCDHIIASAIYRAG